jgi:Na+-transporting NADH:ubiquinone oxidoreductase subunit NqrD
MAPGAFFTLGVFAWFVKAFFPQAAEEKR